MKNKDFPEKIPLLGGKARRSREVVGEPGWRKRRAGTRCAMVPFSILDLSPIATGASVLAALNNSRDLAQHAERLGYRRFWLAEHRSMSGIASAATAHATSQVRVYADCPPPAPEPMTMTS